MSRDFKILSTEMENHLFSERVDVTTVSRVGIGFKIPRARGQRTLKLSTSHFIAYLPPVMISILRRVIVVLNSVVIHTASCGM